MIRSAQVGRTWIGLAGQKHIRRVSNHLLQGNVLPLPEAITVGGVDEARTL